jgi:hypothetical protein
MAPRAKIVGVAGTDTIASSILVLRNQNILLDAELAALYGLTTKRLNEQVRRNRSRFPADFMFQLSGEEAAGRTPRRTSVPALRVHGAGRGDAILGSFD